MAGGFLLSIFPLGDSAVFFARLTCRAIDDSTRSASKSRLVFREELLTELLKTSLQDSALDILQAVDEYRLIQVPITGQDMRVLRFEGQIN